MQSCMFNNLQCPKTGPSRFQYKLRVPRSPTIVHAKPWTSCHNKLSVSCTALASWTIDDHSNTIGPSSGDYVLPSVWGDYFATYTPPVQEPKEWMEKRIIELKEEVKMMLGSTTNIAELMDIVDTIQRLGIGYHFDNDIDDALSHLHDIKLDNEDLHNVSLRFRLLRQHGFNVSSDVFIKFIDSDGKFDEALSKDARGLLSLYNAGYLAFPGETILDEAISFASDFLKSMVYNLDFPLKREVLRALKTPLHQMVPRIEAMFFIEEYTEKKTRNDTLLKLAKLDYNLVQRLHLDELKELTLWWKEQDLSDSLTYTRDRVVENYFWAISEYFEPHYSRARIMLTKYYIFLVMLDDTYDVYGNYEGCRLLTDAIQRWDERAIDCLPVCLRGFYQKFINTVNGFHDELEPSEKYRISYLIQETQRLADSYMQELEWHAKRQVPTFQERKKPAIDGNAGSILVCGPLLGMGEEVTEEAIQWLLSLPDVVMGSFEVCRYTDDAVNYEREKAVGQAPTTIFSYMVEHNLRKDEAAVEFECLTKESWKKMNPALLRPTKVPRELIDRMLNYARMCTPEYLIGFTYSSKFKEIIGSLMLKSFSL